MLDYSTALICACVEDEKAFLRTKEMGLHADAFTDPFASNVWDALCANFSEGLSHEKLELDMRLQEMFPETAPAINSWLSLSTSEVGKFDGADKWLDHVTTAWQAKRKQEALAEVTELAAQGAEPSEIARELADRLTAIEDSTGLEEHRLEKQRDAVKKHNEARIQGNAGLITTGIGFIDHQLGKVRSHEYIVCGARPSVGKSALARELMMSIVKTKKQPVLMFSLEMPVDEVVLNLASTNCGVSVRNVEDDFEPNKEKLIEENRRFADALGKFLHIKDGLCEIRDIEHEIGLAMRRYRPAMVIIDYLQLMQASHLKVRREQEVAHISRRLKLLANQYRVPMLVLAQLNRVSEQEEREPKLSDLRESGSLEQDADAVWFLHRPKDAKMVNGVQERKFIQAKRRGGEVADFNIGFLGRTTKFFWEPVENLEQQPKGDMWT